MRKPDRRDTNRTRPRDWTALCAEAAAGGLSALAAVPMGDMLREPVLRRLLQTVAAEAATAAGAAGHRLHVRPGILAERLCRKSPGQLHPWLRKLRRAGSTGAGAAFAPLLAAARRTGSPADKLTVIAAVLRRLEKTA